MKPILIVNFKTYSQATGSKALELAKACDKVAKELDSDVRIAVQAVDLRMVCEAVSIPVYAQHIDPVGPGSHTGHVLLDAVIEAGAKGTLLNHSENRIPHEVLEKSISMAREKGLVVVACAKDDDEGSIISGFNPDFVAVEPPELIGGDISVSSARPELISDSVEKISKNVLVGAGVKTGEDVRIALELGSVGVLLASGVTKADDPEAALRELLS